MKPSFLDTEPLWSARERYSGKTQEIIERAVRECGSDANHPGIKILVQVMAWLTIPLARRSKYRDERCYRMSHWPPIPSSVPDPEELQRHVYYFNPDPKKCAWGPPNPNETCHHCHTTQTQTGKRRWDRCDVCGVNLR